MVMETTGERRLPVASTIIHQQIASINAEPERPWDLDQMGSNAGYSKAHYRRLFFQYTGESPSRYIRHRRMHKAAHLLQATRLPVKAIAAACGYDDLFHFSKQFKLVYGKPPGVFRRQG
jgi:AraC family transcriptional regulator of arabinose operon